jgi:hypothetical protein
VQRGVQVLADRRRPLISDQARANLFGGRQYEKR